MKFTDLFVGGVVSAIDIQADEEFFSFLEIQGYSEFVTWGCVELRVLEFVGFKTGLITAAPVGHAIGEVIDEAGFWEIVEGSQVNVPGDVGVLVRVQRKGLGSTHKGSALRGQSIATKGEGVEWKLGVHRQLGFPCVRLIGGLDLFPEAGNRIRCVAVVDLNVHEALLLGGSNGKVGGVLLDFESRRWCGRDVLLNTGEVLLEPMVKHDPLLRSRAVLVMHVAGNTPLVMRQQVHGLVDTVQGGVLVIGRGDEHDRYGDVLPVGARVDGVFVEIQISDIVDVTSRDDTS